MDTLSTIPLDSFTALSLSLSFSFSPSLSFSLSLCLSVCLSLSLINGNTYGGIPYKGAEECRRLPFVKGNNMGCDRLMVVYL